MNQMTLAVLLAGVSALTSYGGGWVLRIYAARFGLVDRPSWRSEHIHPVATGGGVGIVIAVLVGLLLLGAAGIPASPTTWWVILAGGLAVAAVSLADDVRTVSPSIRLVVHALAAAMAVTLLGPVELIELPGLGTLQLGSAAWIVSVVWVTGLTNAFNFMDGLDGLAAGQATLAAAGWALMGWSVGRLDIFALGIVVAAAAFGFLLHNWSPARLFMGDVGSAFLGYVLGVASILGGRHAPVMAVAGVLLVWPFVFDPVLTLIRRAIRRENVLLSHRSHLYQRLAASGLGHERVTLGYLALAALAGGVAVLLVRDVRWAGPSAIVGAPASALLVWTLVLRREQAPSVRDMNR
jgi:UDP-N-acetylmuramyl pentapeptide phosphotransferase/UDP-N-acetylglucosamine-1-phosphate transferase